MRKAVYAGSFDPATNGHDFMIKEGAKLFDRLVVAIGTNTAKIPMFNMGEKINLLNEITKNIDNVEIDQFGTRILVKYAKSIGAQYLLRGIRHERDFESEFDLREKNAKIDPDITTIFIIPPHEYRTISSSFAKEMTKLDTWEDELRQFVPRGTYKAFLEKTGRVSRDSWEDLCKRLGLKGDVQSVYDEITSKYFASKRHYHTLQHIANLMHTFDENKDKLDNALGVELGLWLHDVEDKPADCITYLLKTFKPFGLDDLVLGGAESTINATNHFEYTPQTKDEMYSADIDLRILAAEEAEFNQYDLVDIRNEYIQFPDEKFKEGRSMVLGDFLERESIYWTSDFQEKYEARAENNLEMAISRLK